jgi:hypothetical protein
MSMKSEARAKPSQRTIHLASLAPHNVELNSPEDCRCAIWQAVAHLGRYERLIYLRGSDDHFPAGDQRAQRYTLFELPKREISGRLYDVREDDFAPFFEDADEARTRNSFSVPVFGDDGRKLFSVTVSRRPLASPSHRSTGRPRPDRQLLDGATQPTGAHQPARCGGRGLRPLSAGSLGHGRG